MSDPALQRSAFGRRLRALRTDVDLPGKALAEGLGWSPSKVSKIEHGNQAPTRADLTELCVAVGAPAQVRDALLAELRDLQSDYATWRRQFRSGGFGRRQGASVRLESEATLVRAYETAVVPGLLQTPQYARHVLARIHVCHERRRELV